MAGTWVLADCPFCGRSHAHIARYGRTSPPGLRIAHCTRETSNPRYYELKRTP